MATGAIFEGLNAEQRRAVEAVRGPVCILAGAGTGKTTTITRRIAYQVASGAVEDSAILAVTFTDKAAGEMRGRLARLGAEGVRAQTFHSAALAQLHGLRAEPPGEILPTKVVALRQIANSLPKPYRFRPAADLATEVEWAKNRRIAPHEYLDSLNGHQPPVPPDLMAGVFRTYERRKAERGVVDFEDVLELAIRMYDEEPDALERFQARYRAFTVDEYQDVNLLQQSLLRRWLGSRDDLCVVGDDYQAIYSFTGASARYLLEMPTSHPRTTVIKLEDNHRSTPQLLEVANRLVPRLEGAPKKLRTGRAPGEPPIVKTFVTIADENAFIVDHARSLHLHHGVPWEEMAIFYRANFRSEDYEELLLDAGIPYQVAGGPWLGRHAARRLLPRLRRSRAVDVGTQIRGAALREGWQEEAPEGLGEQETTRQNDLDRLVRLAEEWQDGRRTVADFVADLERRFGSGEGVGVHLLTLHRAKGLEFDAVLIPRLNEGELPFRRCQTDDAIAEERRLFYVGLTRGRRYLALSCLVGGKQKPSRFLEELGEARSWRPQPRQPAARFGANTGARAPERSRDADRSGSGTPIFDALRQWRSKRARADSVPAYVVFNDRTLAEMAERLPRDPIQLQAITGVGPAKVERYGSEVLALLEGF